VIVVEVGPGEIGRQWWKLRKPSRQVVKPPIKALSRRPSDTRSGRELGKLRLDDREPGCENGTLATQTFKAMCITVAVSTCLRSLSGLSHQADYTAVPLARRESTPGA